MAKKGKVEIDRDLCKGCFLCIQACPTKGLEAEAELNASGSHPARQVKGTICNACGNCYEVCPDVCIRVYELEGAE